MASYTDAIAQFNPYVQQLPVELMMKVGMAKQAQYDAGVQKIQQSIDNVAGLDIYSDIDKQHLQSKLGELGNRLRGVAAGDFSNQQLVNSVAGMTGTIIKDPLIQAAVKSTAHIKSQFEKIKELEKKGLTDKNNDDYFATQLNKYSSRTSLTDEAGNPIVFGEDYTPYTNISKALKEELLGAGLDEKTIEELFETENGIPKQYDVPVMGKDGKQAVDKAGKPVFEKKVRYANVKAVEKIASNRAAVEAGIQNVFRRGDVKKQLQIDGWANYRNTDVETLLNPLTEKHQDIDAMYDQQRLEYVTLMNAENASPETKAAYEEKIKNLDADRANSEKQFSTLYKFAQDDPEAFKQNYYETSVKNDLMREFLKENVAKTFEDNPALKQQNWEQDYAFKVLDLDNRTAYQNATLAQGAARIKLDQSSNALKWREYFRDTEIDPETGEERKKADPNKVKKVSPQDLSLFRGSVPGAELPVNYARNMVEDDIVTLASGKSKQALELYTDMYKKMYPNQTLTQKQIADNIAKHTALHNKNNPNNKITPEQFLFRTVDGLKNKYIEQGLEFDYNTQAKYNIYANYTDELNRNIQLTTQLANETWREIGEQSKGRPQARTTKTINLNGRNVAVTPDDQELFYIAYGDVKNPAHPLYRENDESFFAGMPFIGSVSKKKQQANEMLEKKFGKGYAKAFLNQIDINKISTESSKFNELYNQKLQKIVGVSDVTSGSLPYGDAEERSITNGNIATYIASADARSLGGVSKEAVLGALDGATAISWVGKKPTTFREDWSGKIVITSKADKTGVAQQFVIDDVNKQDLQTLANIELQDYVKKPIQIAIRSNTKTNSTNSAYDPSSPNAWKTAFLKENRADPSVTRAGWTYRADAVEAAEGGGYRMIHYIKPPNGNFTTIYGKTIVNTDAGVEKAYSTANIQTLQSTLSNYLQNQKK